MNYPVWELYYAGGGLLMVVIAVVHVYVAHFAVGGGLFLVITEMKGLRQKDPAILAYTRRHSRFFLLLTMVFGGITGVGIWFTISLISPGPTSSLIHLFVFGWATEWVFFVVEIVALFIYYYRFGKMKPSAHLLIGWFYFAFAWLSLFLINGIIDFMLTPGDWLRTGAFWDAFFNPSMWPALVFRTLLAVFLAGIFGFVTASLQKDAAERHKLIRYCSKWLMLPLPFMLLSGLWYLKVLPPEIETMILRQSPEILPALKLFLVLLPLFLVIGLMMWLRKPFRLHTALAFAAVLLGLLYMGAFEWIREAGRRPYLIYGHTYSNAVAVKDEAILNRKGILASAKWVRHREVNPANMLQAGREIFRLECLACHSVNGPMNDIVPLTRKFSLFGMDAQLTGQGKLLPYMPRFFGTPKERKALANYIVSGIHGKTLEETVPDVVEIPDAVPPFEDADAFVLLAWSPGGVNILSDNDRYWSLAPPGISIYAQLIRRGEAPEIVGDGVELSYAVEAGFEDPAARIPFWQTAAAFFGRTIAPGTGLSGNRTAGRLTYQDDLMAFTADQIPATPYAVSGGVNPFPLFTLVAKDVSTGKILATTQLAATVSTEMNCRTCHGGPWRVQNLAGIGDDTAQDILSVHDRIHRTELLQSAREGKPVLCQSCHQGSIPGIEGDPQRLSLSAAIHGFHANYLSDSGADACHACHPTSPDGHTRAFRGIHSLIDLNCTNCHLSMADHALSLLSAEKKAGKEHAATLMRNLVSDTVADMDPVDARTPWTSQPDCLSCHVDFNPPDTDQAPYGSWTRQEHQRFRLRSDDAGIMCMACHGAAHALYPARNRFGRHRDTLQPLQYQQTPYPVGSNQQCRVCHTIDMEDEIHHPNMLNAFRNTEPE